MSEISKQELLRLVQKASGKPIDTQIFEQLYTRTMSQVIFPPTLVLQMHF